MFQDFVRLFIEPVAICSQNFTSAGVDLETYVKIKMTTKKKKQYQDRFKKLKHIHTHSG